MNANPTAEEGVPPNEPEPETEAVQQEEEECGALQRTSSYTGKTAHAGEPAGTVPRAGGAEPHALTTDADTTLDEHALQARVRKLGAQRVINLEEKIKQRKLHALQLKRSGDLPAARNAVVEYKLLEHEKAALLAVQKLMRATSVLQPVDHEAEIDDATLDEEQVMNDPELLGELAELRV